MRRRDLLAGLLATTAATALQAAEQNRVHHLAICSQHETDFSIPPWVWLFERLRQMGFEEGKNLIVDRYVTEGRPDNYAEVARKIVQAKPDVIALGFDHQLILEVAKETSTIPIIATFGDPVAAGIVKNMARPEGNISGVSLDAGIEMQGKHLEILRQALPSASRIAYLSNRAEWEGAWGQAVRDAGQRLGVSIIGIPMDRSAGDAEYRQAFETMARQSVQALMANGLPPNFEHRDLILELAVKYRLPSITWWTGIADQQLCFAYTPDYPYYFHLWGDEVGQVLNGTAPADIPIQQATKLTLTINLKIAKAIGLDVPETLIARADNVIE
ncbi:ABC transporter substrate-binding protein (plasmid) [Bradyrhizobium sp. CB82]|uniref:ABC transporter substrate-binding protein n=1 Tax=Bradyrhizobium sp. CB82 TaxID=3039159 RepID=UPI0024B16A81|nr:ABC transporter substrate-binding protein [Bradyrhizobium sp. CB82]WFU46101.1 ABC transporter substrate-binding protein [Bradyrhizobium sp. CB82]